MASRVKSRGSRASVIVPFLTLDAEFLTASSFAGDALENLFERLLAREELHFDRQGPERDFAEFFLRNFHEVFLGAGNHLSAACLRCFD